MTEKEILKLTPEEINDLISLKRENVDSYPSRLEEIEDRLTEIEDEIYDLECEQSDLESEFDDLKDLLKKEENDVSMLEEYATINSFSKKELKYIENNHDRLF